MKIIPPIEKPAQVSCLAATKSVSAFCTHMPRIFDQLNMAYLECDNTWKITLLNTFAATVLGATSNSLIGTKISKIEADIFTEDGRKVTPEMLEGWLLNLNDTLGETVVKFQPGHNKAVRWFSLQVRKMFVLENKQERIGFVFNDVTAQKQDEIKLENRLKLEKVVSRLSTLFTVVNSKNIDDAIHQGLEEIAKLSGIDRSYVFLYNNEKSEMSNTHEWCNENIQAEKDILQNLPKATFPWWIKELEHNRTIYFNDIRKMPDTAMAEREILELQSVLSILVVPIRIGEETKGFLGFDSVEKHKTWQKADIRLLRTVSEVFGNGFETTRLREELVQKNLELNELLNQRTAQKKDLQILNNAIVESLNGFVLTCDQKGRIKSVNEGGIKLFGYSKLELFNQLNIVQLIHPEEFSSMYAGKTKNNAEPFEFNYGFSDVLRLFNNPCDARFFSKTKKEISVFLSVVSLNESRNEAPYYAFVGLDNSSRKAADQALQLQKAAFDTFAHPLYLFRITGDIIWANKSFSDTTGYSMAEVIGQNIETLQKTEHHSKEFYNDLWTSILTGKIWKGEIISRKKDGTHYPEELTITPLKNSSGQVTNFVAIKIDITERKKNEAAQRVQDKINHVILSHIPDLLIYFDRQGNYLSIHTQNEKLLIVPREKLIGKNIREFLPKHLVELMLSNIDKAFKAGSSLFEFDMEMNGKTVYFENRIEIISDNEILSIIRDVSLLKEKEKSVLLLQDLGANLSKSTNLAHAMNAVVGAIKGLEKIGGVGVYLSNVSKDLELKHYDGLSEQADKQIQLIHHSSDLYKLLSESGSFIQINNSEVNADSPLNKLRESFHGGGAVPITVGHKLAGLITFRTLQNVELSMSDKRMLESLSPLVGGAIARINSQEQLLTSQANFRLMFEALDDFIFIFDKNGRVVVTNPIVTKRLGYSDDEIRGKYSTDFFPPVWQKNSEVVINTIVREDISSFEIPLYTKSKQEIPAETKVVKGKWNGEDAVFAIARDVTERVKTQKKLKESEQRWQYAIESSGYAIWDWNIKTNAVFFSSSWASMLGHAPHELKDRLETWIEKLHPDDADRVLLKLNKTIDSTEANYISEYRLRCKDGTYKWVLDRGKVLEYDDLGKPQRMLGTMGDMTERRTQEESLVQALGKEKKLNELKSRFVSMTSHEFRTPLSIILTTAETMEAYLEKMTPTQQRVKLEKIAHNVHSLRKVLEKLMDLSQIERGVMKYNPERTNFCQFIKKQVNSFRDILIGSHQLELKCPDRELVVHIDRQMIKQALDNLLNNAVKFSAVNTTIRVEIESMGDNAILSVSDQGIGIKEVDRENLLAPFHRGQNVGKIHGTGLGLALANQLVLQHGGSLDFVSKEGKGSTFSIRLPI